MREQCHRNSKLMTAEDGGRFYSGTHLSGNKMYVTIAQRKHAHRSFVEPLLSSMWLRHLENLVIPTVGSLHPHSSLSPVSCSNPTDAARTLSERQGWNATPPYDCIWTEDHVAEVVRLTKSSLSHLFNKGGP